MPNPNFERGSPPSPQPFVNGPAPAPEPLPKPYAVEFSPGKAPFKRAPHPRRPPGRKEKEKRPKPLSKSARYLVRLFNALDAVSEWAELVDAFYKALPRDVRRKWEANHSDGRGLIDQAGQYGIAGADWKARALWYNWDKLDTELAFRNILANNAEDQLHGLLHRHLPPGAANAIDAGYKEFAQGVSAGTSGAAGV